MLAVCKSVGFGFISAAAALKVVQTCTSAGDGILKGFGQQNVQKNFSRNQHLRPLWSKFSFCILLPLSQTHVHHQSSFTLTITRKSESRNSGLTLSFTLLFSFILLSWSAFFIVSLMSIFWKLNVCPFIGFSCWIHLRRCKSLYWLICRRVGNVQRASEDSSDAVVSSLLARQTLVKVVNHEFLQWRAHELPSPLCQKSCTYFPFSSKWSGRHTLTDS